MCVIAGLKVFLRTLEPTGHAGMHHKTKSFFPTHAPTWAGRVRDLSAIAVRGGLPD